jgi:hypothetical protein
MPAAYPRRPFSMPVVKHAQNFSGTAGTMITRVPWQAPVNKAYYIRKLVVSNTTAVTSGGATVNLVLWDVDLSNTSPVARGSGLLPLITVPLNGPVSGVNAVQGPIVIQQDGLPQEFFQGGITASTTISTGLSAISGIAVSLELEAV